MKRSDRTGGFDLALAQTVAEKLGRSLSVQWFETEDQVLDAHEQEGTAFRNALEMRELSSVGDREFAHC
jgi:hypothetical protein